MDGIHDLGGKHGFGMPEVEQQEPAFHERWEAAVYTMLRAARVAGAIRNSDQFRHAIERIEPAAYLAHGYYGRWLGGIETLLVEAGVIDRAALDARVRSRGGDPDALVAARPDPSREPVAYEPQAPGSQRSVARAPGFALHARVRTRAHPVPGHTRLPAYARGRIGTIVALHGGWVFPDTNADGRGEQPEHLYTVAFAGTELWGAGSEPDTCIHLDLFEAYLEAP
jgi:nitrile hydratase beta subunit